METEMKVGETTRFGSHEWRVLAVEDGKALLLAENVIEKRAYNDSFADTTWAECTLRKYLNGEFYKSFSEEEKGRILVTHNENPNNTYGIFGNEPFNTPGGEPTDDKVFLLSLDEVRKYLGDEDSPSQWEERPLDIDGDFWWIGDEYNSVRICEDLDGRTSWWWLRSPGLRPHDAAPVGYAGGVGLDGRNVHDSSGGVRPAVWVNLESGNLPIRESDPAFGEWIPTSERLPEPNELVLIVDKYGNIIASRMRECGEWYCADKDITEYWMPLPKPPVASYDV